MVYGGRNRTVNSTAPVEVIAEKSLLRVVKKSKRMGLGQTLLFQINFASPVTAIFLLIFRIFLHDTTPALVIANDINQFHENIQKKWVAKRVLFRIAEFHQ